MPPRIHFHPQDGTATLLSPGIGVRSPVAPMTRPPGVRPVSVRTRSAARRAAAPTLPAAGAPHAPNPRSTT